MASWHCQNNDWPNQVELFFDSKALEVREPVIPVINSKKDILAVEPVPNLFVTGALYDDRPVVAPNHRINDEASNQRHVIERKYPKCSPPIEATKIVRTCFRFKKYACD